ncbi:uncharacterized protein Tco025E_02255 [Trypanosoma conorhini]|uniref:Uncharacterized protein n=1 Tax=Trypanosoma conorhini TaxID=83891 RepID=A0A3R7NQN7_9TRYP|nr:uncharacterized protein Tco025E_02255 [Trypanosoma conorhini]RNF25575.1 hypothetical protein Tco025E_02255 [Trypanosoma conorhini]
MLRRAPCLFAANIPRSAWDPAHFNTNWSDSYSSDIAARRHWPAKKWSIGLEPRTPRDWLQFSYRNLAYAYNGALRACQSFPEMLVYYKEMKQRGVKVDVDTMNVLLTRAARYERIQVDDVFLLFDELTALGARPDIAAVETLHTVLDHSAAMPQEWREARRRQLVELYNCLAIEEIERLAPHRVDRLLKAQVKRYRDNLRALKASLSPSVYRRYLHTMHSASLLLEEVHNFLWELVESDHPAMEIPALQLRIPFVGSVLRRPDADANASLVKFTDFEDTDVCSVFLAAAERAVDADLHDARPVSERRIFLSLLTMISYSGVLYTADLMAHLMEMVKYSTNGAARDSDAQRLLRYAIRGSGAAQDEAHRALWQKVETVADSRVVGRYLGAREPWSPTRVCFDERGMFKSYPPLVRAAGAGRASASAEATTAGGAALEDGAGEHQVQRRGASNEMAAHTGAAEAEEEVEGVRGAVVAAEPAAGAGSRDAALQEASHGEQRTVEALNLRWSDVHRLIERTRALTTPPTERHPQQEKMEVFTGIAVYLRTLATGRRYGGDDEEAAEAAGGANPAESQGQALFAAGYGIDVWARVFDLVQEVRHDMEKFITDNAAHHVEPEFECWEALLVTLRCVLDFCVVQTQEQGKGARAAAAAELFEKAMRLRNELVEESRTRFGGRMRILWLQEA